MREIIQDTTGNSETLSRLWYRTAVGTVNYNSAGGGRDVLIIVSDPPLPYPEAVARKSGELTKEDQQRLQNQGMPPDCQDELAIAKERCKLDKTCRVVGVKSGNSLSREEVIKSIRQLLTTTQNDGGKPLFSCIHQVYKI